MARRGRLSAEPERRSFVTSLCGGNLLLQSKDFSRPGRGVAWRRFGVGCIRGEAQDGIRVMGGGGDEM